MAGKYFKFNFTCIIHREAVGRELGIFQSKTLSRLKMKQLPGQANCSGDSLLPCDTEHTHTSAYLYSSCNGHGSALLCLFF